MKKKLFVISMDAMVHEDIAYLSQKPNFKKIMEKRAEVEGVTTVYPASTYPAHTTLMTGCYPGKHGVFANFQLKTFNDGISHWATNSNWVYVEDIFAAAKRAGCTTASVYWPITANNPNVDYIINEYFFYYPDEINRVEEVFAEQGANEAALKAIRENMHLFPRVEGGNNPLAERFDGFLMGCTCSLIRNEQPDVILVHNCILDTFRHKSGVFGDLVTKGLDRTDEWLGNVISAMEDAGVYEDTNFVILSDHGQMDMDKYVHLNALFRDAGLLEVDPNGGIYNWKAYAQANGFSTTVHLVDNSNKKLYDQVYAFLQQLQESGKYGIRKIYTKDELLEQYGQNGPYSFMVEAEDGYGFANSWTAEHPVAPLPNGGLRGAHGHTPERGPQPVFLAHGPAFKDGAYLENAKAVDIAPTLAAALGQTMPEADGRVLTELLK